MSITDSQIRELCTKMNIPLADIVFKDQLPKYLEYNKAYFINLEDEKTKLVKKYQIAFFSYLNRIKSINAYNIKNIIE